MSKKSEEEIKEALKEVLDLYGVDLEEELSKISEKKPKEERLHEAGDYGELISKTQRQLDDLNERAEEIVKSTGMTREQLETYASNPNNFTREQWEALQKVREACDRHKREARTRLGEEDFDKRIEKGAKKKQTQRFAKKKHWIPL